MITLGSSGKANDKNGGRSAALESQQKQQHQSDFNFEPANFQRLVEKEISEIDISGMFDDETSIQAVDPKTLLLLENINLEAAKHSGPDLSKKH